MEINLPRTALKPEVTFEWKIPKWSNTIERDRARTYFQAYAAACRAPLHREGAGRGPRRQTKTWEPFKVPDEGIGCGFTEAVRGVLSHHMVIRGGKIANYHPYPPTPWNANPRDVYGTPGPYEDAVQDTPIFEENDLDNFKGIDIMRTVRSFDPCLPCGVHMYLGKGKVLKKMHSPTRSYDPTDCWPERRADIGTAGPPGDVGDRIERLLDELQADRRPARRRAARSSCCGSSPSCTAAGLARVVELVPGDGARARRRARRRRARREPARSSTGCIPTTLETAGRAALDSVRPFLGSHGGDVELLDVDEHAGAVHLRLLGSCDGCPSSAVTLQHAVERAIVDAAPEIVDHRRRGAVDRRRRSAGLDGTKPVALEPATG